LKRKRIQERKMTSQSTSRFEVEDSETLTLTIKEYPKEFKRIIPEKKLVCGDDYIYDNLGEEK